MKSAPFLICAMPRSGSAWLANFLTYDGCICLHDPLAGGEWPDGHHALRGCVDTGAAHFLDRLPSGLRLYSLTRNAQDARDSLERLGLPVIESPAVDAPAFHYERLFDIGYLREIWAEIVGSPFDELRAAMLLEMNVQRDMDSLRKRVTTWLG